MDLITKNLQPFCRMLPTGTPDAAGGCHVAWTQGAAFDAALSPLEPDREASLPAYRLFVPSLTELKPFAVVKRLSDGQTFTVLPAASRQTPAGAGLRWRVYVVRERREAHERG